MKNKYFSFKLFMETMRQFRLPAWIMTGILCVITATTDFIVTINGAYADNSLPAITEFVPGLWVYMYVAPVVLTFLAFDFLNSRSHSDFYHSLPNTRQSIFLSRMAAVMAMTVGGILCSCVVSLFGRLVWSLPINMGSYGYIILFSIAASTVMAGGVSLAKAITGTKLSNIVAVLLILYFPRLVLFILASFIESVAPVLVTSSMGFWFSFRYNLAFAPIGFIEMGDKIMSYGPSIIYSLALGLAYAAFGLWAFVCRRSETADKAAPNKKLHRAYALALATPLSLVITNTIVDWNNWYFGVFSMIISLAVLNFIIYMVYEMVTIKNFKRAFSALPALLILGVVCIGLSIGAKSIARAAMNNVPEREDIKGVYISTDTTFLGNLYSITPTYNEILQDKAFITNDEFLDLTHKILKRDIKSIKDGAYTGYPQIVVKFVLKNGKTVTRQIDVTAEIDQYKTALLEDVEYKKASAAYPTNKQIKGASLNGMDSDMLMDKLIPTFLGELVDRTDEERIDYFNSFYNSEPLGYLGVYGYLDLEAFDNHYHLNMYVPETTQKMIDIMYESDINVVKELLQGFVDGNLPDNYSMNVGWYEISNNKIKALENMYYNNYIEYYDDSYLYEESKTYAPEKIEEIGYVSNLLLNDLTKAELADGTVIVSISIWGSNHITGKYESREIFIQCTEELAKLCEDLQKLWSDRYGY